MSSIEAEIMTDFYERLATAEGVSDTAIAGLKEALADCRLPKPENLAALFATQSGEPLA